MNNRKQLSRREVEAEGIEANIKAEYYMNLENEDIYEYVDGTTTGYWVII